MAITTMLAGAFGRAIPYLPNIIAGLVILAVGLLVSKLLEKLTRRLLSALGLHRRRGASQFIENTAALERLPHAGGRIVYWVFALVTIGVAVDALNLPWLSAGVARVLAYVPKLLAACLIVIAGYIGGNFLGRQIAAREGATSLLGRLVRGAIFIFAGFMALQELGIASAIVTTAFTLTLAALAIAGALAFGLGNRELAGRITQDWYDQRRPRVRRYEPRTSTRTLEEEEADRRNPPH